jgi:hypothetical protein
MKYLLAALVFVSFGSAQTVLAENFQVLKAGAWKGDGIKMKVDTNKQLVTYELGCGNGGFVFPKIDENGDFKVLGFSEHGPIQRPGKTEKHPTLVFGNLQKKTLTLNVTNLDNEALSVQTFTVVPGVGKPLMKCMANEGPPQDNSSMAIIPIGDWHDKGVSATITEELVRLRIGCTRKDFAQPALNNLGEFSQYGFGVSSGVVAGLRFRSGAFMRGEALKGSIRLEVTSLKQRCDENAGCSLVPETDKYELIPGKGAAQGCKAAAGPSVE